MNRSERIQPQASIETNTTLTPEEQQFVDSLPQELRQTVIEYAMEHVITCSEAFQELLDAAIEERNSSPYWDR